MTDEDAPRGITVFGFGTHGVNVSDDPLHTTVGDVVRAQNAYFHGSGQRGGLSKRGGMRVFNTSALHGAVLVIYPVLLADASPGTILTDSDLVVLTDDNFVVLTET